MSKKLYNTYGIDVPTDEQETWAAAWHKGADAMSEDEVHDMQRLFQLANTSEMVDIGHQHVPGKYMILCMCAAICRSTAVEAALLAELEAKYTK